MLEILRDPLWQFIGVLVAVIAVIVPIYIYILQKGKKDLAYCIVAKTPLLAVDKALENKIEIYYQDTLIGDVFLLLINISNKGNEPIKGEDFFEPLNFSFGNKSKILSAEISESIPAKMKLNLEIVDNKLEIRPVLLNTKDEFTIKLLISQFDGSIEPGGIIYGVKTIREIIKTNTSKNILRDFLKLAFILLCLGAIANLYFLLDFKYVFDLFYFTFVIIIFLFFTVKTIYSA